MVTATLPSGISPYATLADVRACPPCDRFGEDDEGTLSAYLRLATDVLYQMTARQFTGQMTTTLRPCCGAWLSGLGDDFWRSGGYPTRPEIVSGRWYNLPVGPSGCACVAYECGVPLSQFEPGVYPISEATAKIDGSAFAEFRIDENRYLVRTDGDLWPTVQNLAAADTAVGTWSVTVKHGTPPPSALVTATARLACELAKHARGDDDCAIPLRVTTVNRQGATYTLANVQELIDRGNTGLYDVDLVVGSLNPNRLSSRPRVASPDSIAGRPRRT